MSENPATPPTGSRRAIAGLLSFLVIVGIGLLVAFCTPIRHWFTLDSIRDFAASLGWWGPVVIAAFAVVSPLLFLPRWPVAVVSGLLYGVVWGSLLANVASTLGAWLHFALARTLLAPMAQRIRQRYAARLPALSDQKAFIGLFLLRAFPSTSFVLTNLAAGAMEVPVGVYLSASFLGMIPSTLMYAAWGKVLKKPSPVFWVLAIASLVAVVAGMVAVQRRRTPGGVAGGG